MNQFFIALCVTAALCSPIAATAQDSGSGTDRQPAFAGTFYPASPRELRADLEDYFARAMPAKLEGRVRTLIVPHAGYDYSGVVAASGYKSIPKDAQYKNIFIIASSHREQFKGASVYAAGDYITPLGEARVNREIARQLIDNEKSITYFPKAHDREHSIEVQIPFIQYHFTKTPAIVPIVMGSSSLSAASDLAAALLPWFTPENLFIISSDFSHYPSYKDAKRIDKLTAEAILTKDPELFYKVLRKNSSEGVKNLATPSCGWSSIMTMLYMADRKEEIEISPVLYRNSGDSPIGDKERVVGYWAIAGYEKPTEPLSCELDAVEKKTLLAISRSTLETYLISGTLAEVSNSGLTGTLRQPAGAFVSLYMGGKLRGCIGNFTPDKPLYMVVQEMTLAAALNDRRFAPVEASELEYISIEVSVLTPLHKIGSIDEFQLGLNGIYMKKGDKSGTFLPQVAQSTGWNTEEFFGHCAKDKAGMGWDGWKEADLYVYEAIVFGEEKIK
ncbi:MAG: AmmeMemoRadiSam system protein B [Bacteroidales bacterium]|nr:AmmeMemoRadiSam system protein B [Bacteroidales bacterium]